MSEDEQAKKLTQDLFDAAVDRAIINQKAQGREFSLQDIKRLKAKHVFGRDLLTMIVLAGFHFSI